MQEDVKQLRIDVEKLKDGQRGLNNGNGNQKWKSQCITYIQNQEPTETSSEVRKTPQKERQKKDWYFSIGIRKWV